MQRYNFCITVNITISPTIFCCNYLSTLKNINDKVIQMGFRKTMGNGHLNFVLFYPNF